jgi:hypothetical protein
MDFGIIRFWLSHVFHHIKLRIESMGVFYRILVNLSSLHSCKSIHSCIYTFISYMQEAFYIALHEALNREHSCEITRRPHERLRI